MKIISYYLPQFHSIKENDEWWGKGYTEWTNVIPSKPIFEGHYQPKVPLNNNYYNLLDDNVKLWQVNLAKMYGIYGFCYYHYWYNGHMLLEKPLEQVLKNKQIDFPFCICWANEPWTRIWEGNDKKVLISQFYGEKKEWEEHFNYLFPFFKDERYIKENNKPIVIIYRPEVIGCVKEMLSVWDDMAKRNGFNGIKSMCCIKNYDFINKGYEIFDNIIEWQPALSFNLLNQKKHKKNFANKIAANIKLLRRKLYNRLDEIFGHPYYKYSLLNLIKDVFNNNKTKLYNYNELWENIVNNAPINDKMLPGAFIRYDNTPRYKKKATVTRGDAPEIFKKYMIKQIINARENYKTDKLFFFAWNEWAEGAMLEPDEKYGYSYLEALKEALIETDEYPY